MNSRQISIIILLPLFLYSCAEKKGNNGWSFITLRNFETHFDFKYIAFVPTEISTSSLNSNLQLYFQDFKEKKTILYTLNKDTILNRSNEDLKMQEYFFETVFKSDASIYQLKIGTKCIVLRNREGDILNTYNLDQKYNPIIFPPADLKYRNNYFIMGNASSTIGMGLKKDRLLYYQAVKPILLAKIIDTTLQCKAIGDFPEKYITTGNSYNDHLPSACIGENNKICVSFGADANLSLYRDSTFMLRKEVKSIYVDKFNPYPDEKLFDMLYLKNYTADEPKYISVIYDQFENVYYRIVKHRRSNSGSVSTENTWSVIITDSELNVLGEVKFSGDYKYDIFVPTPLGIVTAKRSPRNSDKAMISLIKITRNAN